VSVEGLERTPGSCLDPTKNMPTYEFFIVCRVAQAVVVMAIVASAFLTNGPEMA